VNETALSQRGNLVSLLTNKTLITDINIGELISSLTSAVKTASTQSTVTTPMVS
jgi:hypothetical protein